MLPLFRSGKRLKKTRKYDIITTPAERVEMAPLNEEDDEDEDSTVFDIKYRCGLGTEASSWLPEERAPLAFDSTVSPNLAQVGLFSG